MYDPGSTRQQMTGNAEVRQPAGMEGRHYEPMLAVCQHGGTGMPWN